MNRCTIDKSILITFKVEFDPYRNQALNRLNYHTLHSKYYEINLNSYAWWCMLRIFGDIGRRQERKIGFHTNVQLKMAVTEATFKNIEFLDKGFDFGVSISTRVFI